MDVELKILSLGAILLLVHIFIAGAAKTKQYGIEWNTGARDESLPPPNPIAARLSRAQANFQETFPLAVAVLLAVVVAERQSDWTAIGGWIWLSARVIYLPLYAFGVPKVRSLSFLVSLVGLGLVMWPLLFN